MLQTVFEGFAEPALADGRLCPAPEPLIAGQGLADIPAAMKLLRRGLSARKVVVRL
ncbi:MAG: hypothetical protein IIA03_03575 [Proteobacteria bacterium]|nr:hypothetical protein [Burkholderiaceae bacterium]MCH8855327.1 hypothetical protein [Pseudomonadota bacterium]